MGNFMKFGSYNRAYKPASYTRFQKYASDGSGRDKYVVYYSIIIVDPSMEDSMLKKIKWISNYSNSEIQSETISPIPT